ncbi:MAG TPA: SPASM domain-containing protein [Candidatus Goldiibacteriota bacterium]|nr:SPASM domain-containing protein [Candidatus Goldiibacteriota bacterium]
MTPKTRFKRVYVEITNYCNQNCGFCPGTSRKKEFMDEALFLRILEEINGFTEHLYFHVMGEPFLHPKLPLFIDLAGENGFVVNLVTNGSMSDKLTEISGKKALRSVAFSVHGLANVRTGCIDDILAFIKNRRDIRIIYSLRVWGVSSAASAVLNKIEDAYPGFMERRKKAENVRGFKLEENVYYNEAAEFLWPDLNGPEYGGRAFCLGLRDQAAILVDGTVVPCCLDSEGTVALGRIQEKSFKDIIESPRARAIYDGFSWGEAAEELCKKCGFRLRFGEKKH